LGLRKVAAIHCDLVNACHATASNEKVNMSMACLRRRRLKSFGSRLQGYHKEGEIEAVTGASGRLLENRIAREEYKVPSRLFLEGIRTWWTGKVVKKGQYQ